MFFFFQAEDGIRDGHVTGVQTCALPILGPSILCPDSATRSTPSAATSKGMWGADCAASSTVRARSEERRVGKECRCGRTGEQEKKNSKVSRSMRKDDMEGAV